MRVGEGGRRDKQMSVQIVHHLYECYGLSWEGLCAVRKLMSAHIFLMFSPWPTCSYLQREAF